MSSLHSRSTPARRSELRRICYGRRVPHSAEQLFARLEALAIAHHTVSHAPVFTVEEAKAHRGALEGTHVKNLFLRNKKREMWLVVALEDRPIDLKALGRRLGAGNLSFGRPERLSTHLGVEPGSVTPFALINDAERLVRPVLDARILERDPIHAHPLRNDMTTSIAGDDLLRFIRDCGHEPEIVDFDAS